MRWPHGSTGYEACNCKKITGENPVSKIREEEKKEITLGDGGATIVKEQKLDVLGALQVALQVGIERGLEIEA